jgi:hypothetical protein
MEHAPLLVRSAGEPPDNVGLGFAVDDARFDRRRDDLAWLNDGFAARAGDPAPTSRRAVFDRAVRLMRAPELSAFDLDREPAAVRQRYGDTDFGRGCLLARRLVEAGTAVVEVTLDGWDTHQNHFERTRKLMQALDPAWSSLLAELAERDRLDSTLVLWMGEFGRTPRINGREGRDHHPRAYSVALAGGGVRGGVVVGATDDDGDRVVDTPVRVADVYATVAVRMGLEPDEVVSSPGGRPIAITDEGKAIAALASS